MIPARRPYVSTPASRSRVAGVRAAGYVIRGTQHKPMCRCRACKVVRLRAREKLLNQSMGWNCG